MELRLTTSLLLLAASLAISHVSGYDKAKAKVISNSQVKSESLKGDTGDFNVKGDGEATGNYQGSSRGASKIGSGTGKAQQSGKGDTETVIGPDGKKATGKVDKGGKSGEWVDAKGNKLVAKGAQENNINAVVNGKETYKVEKVGTSANVYPKNSNNVAHTVNNLNGGNNVDVRTPNKPQRVESYAKTGAGANTNTKVSDAENQIPGIPLGSKNGGDLNYQGSSKSDIKIGKSFGATNNDALAIGAAGEVQSDSVDTKPCYTGPNGQDALGDSGIKIDDKSIKFELVKASDGSYEFPACWDNYANVFVPANVDVAKLGVNTQITCPLCGGDMQCDSAVSCKDTKTKNRPAGSCFFCGFCDKSQPQGAFGIKSDSNVCDAKAGRTLNLKWRMCPPEGSSSRFRAFQASGQKAEGDVVSVLRLFLKNDKTSSWDQVACKQSAYKFKVGIADGPSYGSKASNTKLAKPSQGGAAPANPLGGAGAGNFGSLLGGFGGKK